MLTDSFASGGMRGHVRRRGRTWTYVIDFGLDPVTGRRRQHTKGGFATKAEAESAMRTSLAKGSSAGAGAGSERLGAYLDDWFGATSPRLQETTPPATRWVRACARRKAWGRREVQVPAGELPPVQRTVGVWG